MTTLKEALSVATTHWANRSLMPGRSNASGGMATFAGVCVGVLVGQDTKWHTAPAQSLTPRDAVNLLSGLRSRGLSPKTVAVYYSAFKTLLKLNGVLTHDWPRSPTVPRDATTHREAIGVAGLADCLRWLDANGYRATASLGVVLSATGLRVASEALLPGAATITSSNPYLILRVCGKGGHVRSIPVVHQEGARILADAGRMAAIRSVPYRTHLRAWKRAVEAVGLKTRLATLHALRHHYACEAYRKSGGNLIMVQTLLGHSDPKTTARYIHQDDTDEQARALASP